MPLSTYANLKAAVADWCHRTDLTTQILDFVALSEAQIRRDVRCRAQQILVTGTLTGEVLAQPTRYIEAERLVLEDVEQDFVAPGMYAQLQQAQSTEPKYTHIGTDLYILNGANGSAYSLLYWQQFTPFSADSDSNWLLLNAPEIYLSGALVQAAVYLNDDAMLTRHAAIYQASVKMLNNSERRAQFSGSRLEIRAN